MNDKLTISENCGLGMPCARVLYQAMVVDPELYSELAGESWRSGCLNDTFFFFEHNA